MQYCRGEQNLVNHLMCQHRIKMPFPLMCINFRPSKRFIQVCRIGIFQFILIKPLLSIVDLVLVYTHRNKIAHIDLILRLIILASGCVAMYLLTFFYLLGRQEMSPYRPLLKFLSIKIVMFLGFWQNLVILLLFKFDIIPTFLGEHTNARLANALLVIEMCGVSILHLYSFPYDMYQIKSFSTAPLLLGKDNDVIMPTIATSVMISLKQEDMVVEVKLAVIGSNEVIDVVDKSTSTMFDSISSTDIEMSQFKSHRPDLERNVQLDEVVLDISDEVFMQLIETGRHQEHSESEGLLCHHIKEDDISRLKCINR
ncbi:hypothetical protein SAMD00019534_060360, partial [Acytostelium subglobosum LB1]|uniref:hypothetical protein n=1 Tax=Acytostelium subglobosum LB1 TaxID=1410327 RepID=UPI0006451954